jgi:acyl transferase domain-containing protein/acyl carrier protein
LKAQPALNLADVAYTLQVGRKAFKHRRMLVARDLAEAAQALMTPEQGRVFTHLAEAGPAPVIFMFPGQGAQAVNMGRTFYETESVFREQIDRCAEILKPQLGFDLRQRLYPAPAELEFVAKQLNETWLTQPALFAIEYALAQQWLAWGIRPQAMIGHSLGEYVAACLAGVFSLEEALTLVATRGQLMSSLPVGAMLAVPKSESEVRPLLGDWLSLAAINAPDQCVVSGPISAIEALRAELQQQGLETQRLQTSHAFHSMMMDPMVESFVAQVRAVNLKTPQLPYLSNVSGAWITAAEATDPDYWGTHLRQTVRFAEGLQTLLQDPQQIFLEVGPGRTLNGLVHGQTGASRPRAVFTSLPLAADQESDPAFLLTTLGRLWLVGASANWTGLYAPGRRRRIPLPTYPFERQRYWLLDESASGGEVQRPKLAKRANMAEWFYGPSWKRSLPLDPEHLNKLAGHRQRWLVFMDACGLGASLVRRLERENQHVIQVNVGKQFGQSQAAYTLNPERPADYESLFKELRAQDLEPHKIIHLWSATPEPAPDQVEEGEQHLTLGFYSLLYLTQALGQLNGAEIRDLTVVSNHVYAVQGDEFIQPEKAAILGPCKVIPHEYPQLRCRHIDLQLGLVPAERMENLLDQLLAEIIAESPDRVVTYRGNHRWIQAAEPVALERVTPPGKKLRERGVYLITGGLGGIGLWLAEYLAQTVQARLILVGRSEFPPVDQWEAWLADRPELDEISHKIRRLQALEAEGAEFSVQTADVTDEAQMQNVVTAARQRWGTIHGVIHAAGVPGGGLIQLKTGEAAAQVLAPKIKGTRVLEKIFKTESLDFFVLCSSLNAILGTLGQVDYCAANAFLDAFALANSAHSQLRPLSINWSRWQNVGMAASAESKHQSLLGESLAEGMTPQEGLEAFGRALARSTFPQIIISPRDFQALLAREAAPPPNWLAQLEAARPIRTSHPRPALGSAYVAPRDEVEQQVANIWQQLLGLDSVGVHDNFFELGGHSLLATQIAARLRDAFPVELPLRRLFDAPTVAQLAEVVRDALIEKLQGLSEEEAERLL